ncbi:hypothetical protein A3J43_01635 [Candidatus Uhrbacteria bacterium RIFCSPHIGHO2_12_FULL_54_23]|uniref:Nucleotidyltransferase n=1 Tax=Candidatus Uhrbacteria bacterium RIFCSPHIGHO2_12_FULL_54_23 TaxID=1802397 RepID=A0A1F7UM01_9BACT|nr:MAG: hypothetical protein A3J43_01635 [Candidatus Uhrbacteria bacterium RIFCSPHIGHO2_12_FULL_54_23]
MIPEELSLVSDDLTRITARLAEVLVMEKSDVIRDSAVKRFELCFESAWKAIKVFARLQGKECYSPRECFRTAYQLGLVHYETDWLDMVKDRNEVTHLYKEDFANEVYGRLPRYLAHFQTLIEALKIRSKDFASPST